MKTETDTKIDAEGVKKALAGICEGEIAETYFPYGVGYSFAVEEDLGASGFLGRYTGEIREKLSAFGYVKVKPLPGMASKGKKTVYSVTVDAEDRTFLADRYLGK